MGSIHRKWTKQCVLHWQQINSGAPSGRFGLTCTLISNFLVLFGGISDTGGRLNDTRAGEVLCEGENCMETIGCGLCVSSPSWSPCRMSCRRPEELKYELSDLPSEMPLPRVGHSATLILGSKILIYGGEDLQRIRTDDFWVLDIGALLRFQTMDSSKMSKKLWRKLRVEGHHPEYRSFHGACADESGRDVYVFGGHG